MLKDFIKENLLKPGLARLGTAGATLLLTGGEWLCRTFDACGLVTESGALVVTNYLIAVALLAYDLIADHLIRKGRR